MSNSVNAEMASSTDKYTSATAAAALAVAVAVAVVDLLRHGRRLLDCSWSSGGGRDDGGSRGGGSSGGGGGSGDGVQCCPSVHVTYTNLTWALFQTSALLPEYIILYTLEGF